MSQLAHLSKLLADPDFQRGIQTEIRCKAAAYNSFIIYRDEQGRMLVEYPGSGQVYEQDTAQQLTLLSVQGEPVSGAVPISKAEAKQRQTK